MSFDSCLAAVLEWEGTYDNDPDDSGGETCFGITRKYQADWIGWEIVEKLLAGNVPKSAWRGQATLIAAVKIYYRALWDQHRVDELPATIQPLLYGGVINQGPRVVKYLQESLVKLCQPCGVDGLVGKEVIEGCAKVQVDVLADLLWKRRMQAYIVAAKKGNNSKYLAGWANRLEGGA